MVYPALIPLMLTSRLRVVDRTAAPHRFKRTRPFRRKTKSGFCGCAIIFQTQSTRQTVVSTSHTLRGTSVCDAVCLVLNDWWINGDLVLGWMPTGWGYDTRSGGGGGKTCIKTGAGILYFSRISSLSRRECPSILLLKVSLTSCGSAISPHIKILVGSTVSIDTGLLTLQITDVNFVYGL